MSKTSSIHVRVEPNVKKEVEKILNSLGMTSAEAINIYLKQIIINSGLPFEVKIPKYNDEMQTAIKEANLIMESPNEYQSYNSTEELMEELTKDE